MSPPPARPGAGSDGIVAFARAGDTGALSSVGCVTDTGGDGRPGTDGFCVNGDALLGASALAVSPDGRHVYVTSHTSNGIAWFARDAATGALAQNGCIKEFPRADRCRAGFGVERTSGVAVSADGKHVYVTAANPGSVSAFSRDPDSGDLEPIMCVSENGSDGLCTDGTALTGASSVTIAPDGSQVFVTAAEIGGVTAYARDAATGRLTPQSCLLDRAPRGGSCKSAPALAGAAASAISPDGKTLFVASAVDEALALFARDAATGALTPSSCFVHRAAPRTSTRKPRRRRRRTPCSPATARRRWRSAGRARWSCRPTGAACSCSATRTTSPRSARPRLGQLTQTGCAEGEVTYQACSEARGLFDARGMAVSSDARSLYVANQSAHAVSVLGANVAVASRAVAADRRGRFRVRLACPAARVRGCAGGLRVGATKTRAYRVRAGASRAVRARLPKRLRRVVRKRGRVRVKVAARDSRRLMAPSVRRVWCGAASAARRRGCGAARASAWRPRGGCPRRGRCTAGRAPSPRPRGRRACAAPGRGRRGCRGGR